jgi:hypothetical protein
MGSFHRRGGDILPGFDCETGKAIGFTGAEWQYRIQGMRRVYDAYTNSIRVYVEDKLRYEIYATESELR